MKFHGIQSLRTAAALAVVCSHLGSYAIQILSLDSPFLQFLSTHGIFRFSLVIFFGISGFVMAHAIRNSPPGEFLGLRLLRIFPTLWIAALGVLAFKLIAFKNYPASPESILAGLTLLPIGERTHYLLGVEWTLVYELFFYLAITLFSALGGTRGVLIGCGLWLAATLCRCGIAPGWGTTERPEWYHLPFSGWHVPTLMGVFTYSIRNHIGALPFGCKLLAPALIAHSWLFNPNTEAWLIIQGVAGSMLVWWFADLAMSENHFMVRMGDASYGIYLMHAQVISVFMAVMHKHQWSAAGPWALLLPALTLSLVIGFAYGWFELHLYRRTRKWFLRNWRPTPKEAATPMRIAA